MVSSKEGILMCNCLFCKSLDFEITNYYGTTYYMSDSLRELYHKVSETHTISSGETLTEKE